MDFLDEVRTHSSRFAHRLKHLETEEATKTALVMPFIQMLGYNIFDPTEVVPEFTADFGIKKGAKVDYAIVQHGQPSILIEAKKCGAPLHVEQESQLFSYFTATKARFGILTDGIVYRFFADIDELRVMDSKPFFELDMLNVTDDQVGQLKKFHKEEFDPQETIEVARELKYTNEIKRILSEEMKAPCDDFVKFVLGRIGVSKNKRFVTQFGPLVQSAFTQYVEGPIDARLNPSLEGGRDQSEQESKPQQPSVTPPPLASLPLNVYLNTMTGGRAEGRQEDMGFVVLAGARVLKRAASSLPPSLADLREAMAKDGRLAGDGSDFWRLTQEHKFRSPSGAASFLLGFAVNGRGTWKDSEGRPLRALLG